MLDDSAADTFCENRHHFTRAEAYAAHDMKGPTSDGGLLEASYLVEATQAEVNKTAKDVRVGEIKGGRGYSKVRLLFTLTHKYGYSMEEAEEAIKYVTRLGLTGNPKIEADMKNKFGTLPPFTAKVRAAQRIKAAQMITAEMLMARTTAVSKIAEQGRKQIVQELRLRGYEAHTNQNKAMFTIVFVKPAEEDVPEHSFQLVGWHGSGPFAGGEKAILEFYDDEKSKTQPVVTIGVINEENINPAKQKEVVQHIMDYVKHRS